MTHFRASVKVYLEMKGYTILEDWKDGETPLGFMAEDQDALAFVEVPVGCVDQAEQGLSGC